MSSATVPLGDLCGILSGFAWSAAKFNKDKRGVPIIRIQNVDATSSNDFVYWDEPYDERFIIRAGDLLLTLSGSFRIESWSGPDALLNQRIIKLTPSPELDRGWLLHVLRPRLGQIERLGKHALVNNVSIGDIRNLAIPLPPLPEQRRIAEILDKAEALRAKRRAAIAQLDTLTQSIFLDKFGDFSSGTRWPVHSFEELVRESKLGLVRNSKEFGPDFPIPYVRMNAISRGGELDLTNVQRTTVSPNELEAYRLESGDFLFNTRNSEELVGKTALYSGGDEAHVFNNNLMRIRFTDAVTPEYMAAAFQTDFIQHQLEMRKSGTTNVFAIYYKDLRSLPVPVPNIVLQRDFSVRANLVMKQKRIQRKALAEVEALFYALQAGVFEA